jgi:hypothetical protein
MSVVTIGLREAVSNQMRIHPAHSFDWVMRISRDAIRIPSHRARTTSRPSGCGS